MKPVAPCYEFRYDEFPSAADTAAFLQKHAGWSVPAELQAHLHSIPGSHFISAHVSRGRGGERAMVAVGRALPSGAPVPGNNEAKVYVIRDICVVEEHRQHDLGTKLVERLLDYLADEEDAMEVDVLTSGAGAPSWGAIGFNEESSWNASFMGRGKGSALPEMSGAVVTKDETGARELEARISGRSRTAPKLQVPTGSVCAIVQGSDGNESSVVAAAWSRMLHPNLQDGTPRAWIGPIVGESASAAAAASAMALKTLARENGLNEEGMEMMSLVRNGGEDVLKQLGFGVWFARPYMRKNLMEDQDTLSPVNRPNEGYFSFVDWDGA